MSLIDRLRAVGGRLGLLQLGDHRPAAGPTKISTRSISLAELESEVVVAGIDALGRDNAELSADFGALYLTAGIAAPAHAWTIERLIAVLREPALAGKERAQVQAAILERLRADGVAVEDLVRDAVARDRAIDAYAEQIRQRLIDRNRDRALRRREIEQEQERLREENERLALDATEESKRWVAWWRHKHEQEEAMAWALGHLLDRALAGEGVSVEPEPPTLEG